MRELGEKWEKEWVERECGEIESVVRESGVRER